MRFLSIFSILENHAIGEGLKKILKYIEPVLSEALNNKRLMAAVYFDFSIVKNSDA